MKATTVLAAALAATFGYGTTAQANIIDLFDDPFPGPQSVIDNTVGGVVFNEYDGVAIPPTIIGGSRDLLIDLTARPAGGNAELRVENGFLSWENGSQVRSTGTVQWDGDDNSPTLSFNKMLVDLINQEGCGADGCSRFIADVVFADQEFDFSIGVYTDASNFSVLSALSLGVPPQQNLSVFEFAWWSLAPGFYTIDGFPFTITSTGTVDFHNVRALELTLSNVTGRASVDLTMDSITKVPEPGTLALLGIGMLAGGLTGRRRMARKA